MCPQQGHRAEPRGLGWGWGLMESTDKQKEAWEWAEQATRLSLACRTASHWWEASGVEARSLLKLYGIRFDILVAGRVGGARWGGQGGGGRRRQP